VAEPAPPSPPAQPTSSDTTFRSAGPAEPITSDQVQKSWPVVKRSMEDPFLVASLGQVTQVSWTPPATVTLTFPASATVSRGRCESATAAIASAWQQQLGQAVSVAFQQLAPDPASPPRSTSRSPLQLREEASRDPIVQQAEMLLGAKIFDVAMLPTAGLPPASTEDESDKRS
jgi:hypothetical protein